MGGDMNIDELFILIESSKDRIVKIDEDFYKNIESRIEELEKMREGAGYDDRTKIEEEIRTLKKLQKRIFEMRTIKIINLVWAEICNTESGIEGKENMIGVEKELYRDLHNLLANYKKKVIGGKIQESKEASSLPDRVLLRIKQNIPEFEGVDGKTYKLRKEDVVLVPSLNANALIKSGIAEKIEVKR